WGVVLLALADHDHTAHLDRGDHRPHGIDGHPVGSVLVAAAHPSGSGEGRVLGHPHELEGKVAVRRVGRGLQALGHGPMLSVGAGPDLAHGGPKPFWTRICLPAWL